MSGRLILLATSPRVPPGLLSRDAWRAIESAHAVLAGDLDEALPAALADDGIDIVTLEAGATPADRARALVSSATEQDTLWLGSADGDPGLSDAVAAEISRLEDAPEVEVLVGSWDVPGGRLLDAVAVMDRLRADCAWVAAQDHASLAPFVIEEAREVSEAIAAVVEDRTQPRLRAELTDELGDLLFQVLFHSRVAADEADTPFDIDDVAAALVDKLVRRNPHVFGDATAETLEEIEAQWQEVKAAERAGEL